MIIERIALNPMLNASSNSRHQTPGRNNVSRHKLLPCRHHDLGVRKPMEPSRARMPFVCSGCRCDISTMSCSWGQPRFCHSRYRLPVPPFNPELINTGSKQSSSTAATGSRPSSRPSVAAGRTLQNLAQRENIAAQMNAKQPQQAQGSIRHSDLDSRQLLGGSRCERVGHAGAGLRSQYGKRLRMHLDQ